MNLFHKNNGISQIQICILFLHVIIAAGFCPIFADKLIDNEGNEFQGNILTVSADSVMFQPDSTGTKPFSIAKKNVLILKYADGKKLVFPVNKQTARSEAVRPG